MIHKIILFPLFYIICLVSCNNTYHLNSTKSSFIENSQIQKNHHNFSHKKDIGIISWNVENFPNKHSKYGSNVEMDMNRVNLLVQKILETNADIFALQEIKSQEVLDLLLEKLGKSNWEGVGYFNTHQGRCYIIKKETGKIINNKALTFDSDKNSEYYFKNRFAFESTIVVNNTTDTLNLINVHLKAFMNKESIHRRTNALTLLKQYMDESKSKKYILLGDFNNEIDKYKVFSKFLYDKNNYRFADYDIGQYKSNPNCSYPKYNSQIDHIILNKPLIDRIDTTYTLTYDLEDKNYSKYISDHRPLYLKLKGQK